MRFGFFGGDLLPDPPKPMGILRNPRAPCHPRGHGGAPWGSQDKRIRKPKLEKAKDRK